LGSCKLHDLFSDQEHAESLSLSCKKAGAFLVVLACVANLSSFFSPTTLLKYGVLQQ